MNACAGGGGKEKLFLECNFFFFLGGGREWRISGWGMVCG